VSEYKDENDSADSNLPLDTAVRRRRTDESFFLRIAAAIAQNERAVERLSR
jgi:hypothetical protein